MAAVQQPTLTPAADLPPHPCPAANGIRGRCSGCWWSLKAGWFRLVDLGEGVSKQPSALRFYSDSKGKWS